MTSSGLYGHCMHVALCDIVAQNTHKINKSKKVFSLNDISSMWFLNVGPYLLFKIYVIQPIGISLRKKTLRPSPDSFHTAFSQWQKGPWVTPKLAVTDRQIAS